MTFTKLAILTTATAAFSMSAFAQLPQSRVLTLDVAQTIATEAMAKCRADGYKVTVLVVDALNAPKAMLRDDGASASTSDSCHYGSELSGLISGSHTVKMAPWPGWLSTVMLPPCRWTIS